MDKERKLVPEDVIVLLHIAEEIIALVNHFKRVIASHVFAQVMSFLVWPIIFLNRYGISPSQLDFDVNTRIYFDS